MVYKIFISLYLVPSMMKFTDHTQCTDTILTSLKNLVIDNSRTTVTFNSTALRTLMALSNSAKMPGGYYIIFIFFLDIFDFHSLLLASIVSYILTLDFLERSLRHWCHWYISKVMPTWWTLISSMAMIWHSKNKTSWCGIKNCETQMLPMMINSKDGKDHQNKYFVTSKKI